MDAVAHLPPSPSLPPAKKPRQDSLDRLKDDQQSPVGESHGQGNNTFRNVSACNRCRQRKNRCDQRLPSCASCEKAGVPCVGYDPITKKEIPRRSVPARWRRPARGG
jgi:hypothetical protein